MGLSSSGKTTLAKSLIKLLLNNDKKIEWLNADEIRTIYNDWDFSESGRLRQAHRIANLANISNKEFVIADFIAPIQEMRKIYNADYIIFMNTIKESSYKDTDLIFEKPINPNITVTSKNSEYWASIICEDLISKY